MGLVADSERFIGVVGSDGRVTLKDRNGLKWVQSSGRWWKWSSGPYRIIYIQELGVFQPFEIGKESLEEADSFAHACDIVFNHYLRSL